jgi:SAM-dependent methyltransferase
MRYYCESFPDAITHVSPSVSMYIQKVLTGQVRAPSKILDLGAGNGRNSIALTKRFGGLATLVDSDPRMLERARSGFVEAGLKEPVLLCCKLEELSSSSEMGGKAFDVVIMSYVLHHIEPSHYPSILEFCRTHVSGHLLIDVYWNRFRCTVGQFVRFYETNWYGLSYEELAKDLAPHFMIESDRIQILPTNVTFNLVCSVGSTSTEFLASRQFDYSINQSTQFGMRRFRGSISDRHPEEPIESFECVKRLAEFFPGEWQLAKSTYEASLQRTDLLPFQLKKACCLLLACRRAGFPLLLKEYEQLFRIKSKKLLKIIAETQVLRPLGAEYFTQRVVRLAALPGQVEDLALYFLSQCKDVGGSPTVSAGTAVAIAASELGISITKKEIAGLLHLSPAAIRNREEIWRKQGRISLLSNPTHVDPTASTPGNVEYAERTCKNLSVATDNHLATTDEK